MKTIQTEKYLILVDETIQPVNGYYYDTFIDNIRNTNSAEYGKSEITLQIIAASPKLGNLPEFQTLPPNTEDDVTKLLDIFEKEVHTLEETSWEDIKDIKDSLLIGYKQAKSETGFSLGDVISIIENEEFGRGSFHRDEYKMRILNKLQPLTKLKEYEFVVEKELIIRDIQDCIGMDGEPNGIDFQYYQPKVVNGKIQGVWKQIS